jgi:hypothetical protein
VYFTPISVTARAPLLETASASRGQVIDNQKIVELPLNGRDYLQLALLSVGAGQVPSGRMNTFSASGQRAYDNTYLLDGLDNNTMQRASQARRAEVIKPSVEAIQEFKVLTNAYSAEFGRAGGGVVSVNIKSGSNALHGSLFEFVRNEKFDAKNFFDPPDQPRPVFKRNQYGFAVGGPIRKDRTFFFGDFEATRIRVERLLPVDAGGHVAPVRGRQQPARHGFEIEDVQRVGRARQGRGGRLRGGRLCECVE